MGKFYVVEYIIKRWLRRQAEVVILISYCDNLCGRGTWYFTRWLCEIICILDLQGWLVINPIWCTANAVFCMESNENNARWSILHLIVNFHRHFVGLHDQWMLFGSFCKSYCFSSLIWCSSFFVMVIVFYLIFGLLMKQVTTCKGDRVGWVGGLRFKISLCFLGWAHRMRLA